MTDLLRNVSEIVTEDELNSLLDENKKPVTYCGYEVSGPVHVGHMVAVNKQMDFLEAGWEVKVLLADLHTLLNKKGSEEWIENMIKYWRASFVALGLKKAQYVKGSDFQLDKEYTKDVLALGLSLTLKRALRSMQEIARDMEHAHVSQVIYPLMQIADIKHLDVDIAYGGLEQRKIHMLARETLPKIGYKKPVCIHTPLLCSLQGPEVKMSSSKPETMIAVDDEPEVIKKRINAAYCPPEREGNPVMEICELVLFPRIKGLKIERPEKFGGDLKYDDYPTLQKDYLDKKLHPQDLKNAVAENLIDLLKPVREHLKKEGLSCR